MIVGTIVLPAWRKMPAWLEQPGLRGVVYSMTQLRVDVRLPLLITHYSLLIISLRPVAQRLFHHLHGLPVLI
jgi:hypothetical protein